MAIYYQGQRVFLLAENHLILENGAVVPLREAQSRLRDDEGGREIFRARLARIRSRRDRLLAESDWTQMLDADLSDEAVWAWRDYRQALRDLPARLTPENLDDMTWPIPPVRELK